MKRFNFSLRRLLELKKYREHQWEIKLGEATGKCEQLKSEIGRRLEIRKQSFSRRLGGNMTDLLVTEQYIGRLDQELRDLRRELEAQEKRRLEVQGQFLEASKERKVYDKLREKRAEEFRKEEIRREIMENDDLNSGTAARRREE